jgi:hypothetical protein
MAPILLYLVFALATGIVAMYGLFIPVIFYRLDDAKLGDKKFLLVVVFSLMCLLFAPFLFVISLTPKKSEIFKDALTRSLQNQ